VGVVRLSRLGIVIQGPSRSDGGSRFIDRNFDCSPAVEATIGLAKKFFDEIVVSTWDGHEFANESWPDSVELISSELPSFGQGNSRKQFLSTAKGIEYLKTRNIDYCLKVRTDQVLPESAFEYLLEFFSLTEAQPKLLLSDYVVGSPFYAGDFVFAGKLEVVDSFVNSFLTFGAKDLHPSVGHNYVLKYLCATDDLFSDNVNPRIPMIVQVSDPRNLRAHSYWTETRQNRFSFLRREDFSQILWRGQRMTEIVPVDGFSFQVDNESSAQGPSSTPSTRRSQISRLRAFREIFAALTQELRMLRTSGQKNTVWQFLRGLQTGNYSS